MRGAAGHIIRKYEIVRIEFSQAPKEFEILGYGLKSVNRATLSYARKCIRGPIAAIRADIDERHPSGQMLVEYPLKKHFMGMKIILPH